MADLAFEDLIPAAEHGLSFEDLIPATTTPAPAKPTGDGSAEAVARGLVNGVPIVGPLAVSAGNRLAAAIRSLQSDTRYSEELRGIEQRGALAAAEHPWASTAAELAGGVAGTVPLAMAAPAAFGLGPGSLAARSLSAGAGGSILGASDAAVRGGGDGASTVAGAAFGFGLGAASPAVAAGAGRVAAGLGARLRPPEAPPTVEALKASAQAAYRRADEAGLQIGQPAFADIAQDLSRTAREAGIDRTIHPKATAAVGRVEEASASSPTLQGAELLRRILKGAAGSLEPDERRIGTTLVERLDERMAGLGPGDVTSGDPTAALAALREGREFWGRARRAEMIDAATLKAERQAARTGSGGNIDNATRQNISAILDSPKKARGFSAVERAAMERVVRGTPIQNAARLAGKLSPEGNGLSLMLGLGATAYDPRALIALALGSGAKRIADAGTARNVSLLDALVRNGGTLPVSPLALPFRETGERLGRGLSFGTLPAANQPPSGR